jgi:radical SAM superfamily enzyme YgiQ (UPF0313 family)
LKTPERVLREIDNMLEYVSFDFLRIMDSEFTVDLKRSLEISEGLKDRDLLWECQTRADSITENGVKELAKNNLSHVFYGVESGSRKIQKIMRKNLDLELVKKIIDLSTDCGIKTRASFQIGMLGETVDTVTESINYANSLNVDKIKTFISTPFSGTSFRRIAKKGGLLISENPEDCEPSNPIVHTGFLTPEEVLEQAERFIEEVDVAQWGSHTRKGMV